MKKQSTSKTPAPAPGTTLGATLGIVELSSIAKGLAVCDRMLKKAQIEVLRAAPVGCGKFLILVTGPEADLQESVQEGEQSADDFLVGWTFIANLHPMVHAALQRRGGAPAEVDAIGIFESASLAALVRAADGAAKVASVRILELTFDLDLGGKGFVTLTGSLHDVEIALDHAERHLSREGAFVHREILARPHAAVGTMVQAGLERACS
jgi:microcompartment protein CcmL/EutN